LALLGDLAVRIYSEDIRDDELLTTINIRQENRKREGVLQDRGRNEEAKGLHLSKKENDVHCGVEGPLGDRAAGRAESR